VLARSISPSGTASQPVVCEWTTASPVWSTTPATPTPKPSTSESSTPASAITAAKPWTSRAATVSGVFRSSAYSAMPSRDMDRS
jgi:hypothetical protein